MADPKLTAEDHEPDQEMRDYIVTGMYRQEIHARISAPGDEEAARKAFEMFQEWLLTMPAEMEGISFGPEDPSLDEEMRFTYAKDHTREDPTYWTKTTEMNVWQDHDGEIQTRIY